MALLAYVHLYSTLFQGDLSKSQYTSSLVGEINTLRNWSTKENKPVKSNNHTFNSRLPSSQNKEERPLRLKKEKQKQVSYKWHSTESFKVLSCKWNHQESEKTTHSMAENTALTKKFLWVLS